jgi:tetratricopeptide (TPR) repeat protein
MKTKLILLIILVVGFLSSGNQLRQKSDNKEKIVGINNPVQGKWVRIGHTGPIGLEFKANGLVEIDFGNDQTIDVTSEYEVNGDTVSFIDKEGEMCQDVGFYKIDKNNYYLSFDFIYDNCNGRIKSTMGFWAKPNFNESLKKIDAEISKSEKPSLYLNRARIYMATGKPKRAKSDLDIYLKYDRTDARAFINRVGTRFPDDMEGVVIDCEEAIKLEPTNKNPYFLRGLALYELGEKEKACESFSKAIELGFSILRIAEQEKCSEYWDE